MNHLLWCSPEGPQSETPPEAPHSEPHLPLLVKCGSSELGASGEHHIKCFIESLDIFVSKGVVAVFELFSPYKPSVLFVGHGKQCKT